MNRFLYANYTIFMSTLLSANVLKGNRLTIQPEDLIRQGDRRNFLAGQPTPHLAEAV